MIKDSHKRPPGFFERQYICRNTKDYWGNFNITVQYSSRISQNLLSNALRNVILGNQNFVLNFFRLSSYSAEDDHVANGFNYEVRPIQRILFSDVVAFETIDGHLDDECFVKMNQFRCHMNVDTSPLWRVILWESNDESSTQYLSFYCDHALFDGTSGVQFHRDLIEELARLSMDEGHLSFKETLFEYELDHSYLPDPLGDALENKIDLYHRPLIQKVILWFQKSTSLVRGKLLAIGTSLSRFLRSVFGFTDYSLIDDNGENKLFRYKPGTVGLIHKYKIINFSPKETSDVLRFCKSEGVTLTPFILIIATRSLEKTIFADINVLNNGKETATERYSTVSKISINGRRHYSAEVNKEKNLKYGVCVATTPIPLPSLADTDDGKLLRVIKKLSSDVLSYAVYRNCFWNFGDYLKTANFWDSFKSQIGNFTRDTLYTSNLGFVNIEKIDAWEVKNIWFTQSNGLVYHFVFSVVSSLSGGLNIGLGYLPEFDEVEGSVDGFVRTFKEDMLNFKSHA
ncbi:hypothetical protein CLIB1423_35S00122 [[Candida] railenensis]|uniref:Alcohol acetyltransferase n=1 Tax=[Candida] railenensis TaxID=45579 RepID=A0A9P0W190_9ASCO|nr:hypothetical protein CLIB1423_35S00122 [[Candida] railenensis]